MIIISDCSKDIVIPAGLGDNPGVVYETSGVKSLNGETGDLKIKTVNGNDILGDGNIEIKSSKYFDLTTDNSKEAYEEISNHWDDQKGYTGEYIFRYKKEQSKSIYTFDDMGFLKGHSVFFSFLDNADAYDMTGNIKCVAIIIWYDDGKYSFSKYENDYTFPKKVSQLTNDSGYQTKAEVDTAIENALGGVQSSEISNIKVLTQSEYDTLTPKDENVLYCIKG